MAAISAGPAKPLGWPDHPEQPHTPELEAAQLDAPGLQVIDRHVLVVGDTRFGVLDGRNYLGYCGACPSALQGSVCPGPCPESVAAQAN